jgi:hypothetical protein
MAGLVSVMNLSIKKAVVMKCLSLRSKTQTGIGLIEVLITTIVVAVGLLAVASLQTDLMSGSGESKIRSEARTLAERKIEELRNNITLTGYNSNSAGTVTDPANPIVGTNATFTRTWRISDVPPFLAGSANRKNISVNVSWGAGGADERVNVVTEMAWIDPADSAQIANENDNVGGTTVVPSPRQNASEDVASENVDANTPTPLPGTVTTTLVGGVLPTSITVTDTDDGGTYELTPITTELPATHFYSANFGDDGIIAVFLCEEDGNGSAVCRYIQNHFGGIALRIAGTIYSTSSNGLDNIEAAWTSSDIHACYNGPVTNESSGSDQFRHRPYECVFAGNCNATADGVNLCDPDVSDAQINDRNVGPGGEYGDVGLLGVDDQGGDREQVCFLEDTTNPATSVFLDVSGSDVLNEDYLYGATKRFYASRKIKWNASLSINQQKSEGINRSYVNHNFLVISRGTGASANQVCNLKASAHNLRLAPREIIRTLDEATDNAVLPATEYTGAAGTAKTYTGLVTGKRTNLRLYIPETGSCYLNNNTADVNNAATAYACAVASDASGVAIKGGSNEHPSLNPAVFASCTKTTDSTVCDWFGNFTATASVTNCTTPWGATVNNNSSVLAYLNATEPYNGTNTCTALPETRTCTDGSLSGSYMYQTCEPAPTADCTAPWGDSVANNSSVTAYENATVPVGFSCASETRSCSNGILSGTFTNASCSVQTTRTVTVSIEQQGTGTVSGIAVTGEGAICDGLVCTVANDWTGTLTATGTCSGTQSTVSGSVDVTLTTVTAATITLPTCTGPVCTTPWSTEVASGGSVVAYQNATVSYPSTCTSETRFCNDGSLSGTYTNQSCSQTCTVPNLIGMSTSNSGNIGIVDSTITGSGYTVGTKTTEVSGQKVVSAQNPTAGTTASCGTAISYTYKP